MTRSALRSPEAVAEAIQVARAMRDATASAARRAHDRAEMHAAIAYARMYREAFGARSW